VEKAYTMRDDSWYRKFVVHPLTKPMTYFCAKLNVSPNTITAISFLFYFLSAVLFGFGRLKIGAVCSLMGFFLDCMDGNVARLNKRSSFFGYWLDGTIDQISIYMILCGLSFHLGAQYLYLAVLFVLIPFTIFYRTALLIDRKENREFSEQDKSMVWKINSNWVRVLYKEMKDIRVVEPFGFFEAWMFLTVLFPLIGFPTAGIFAFFFIWVPVLAVKTIFYFTGKFEWK